MIARERNYRSCVAKVHGLLKRVNWRSNPLVGTYSTPAILVSLSLYMFNAGEV